MKVFEQSIKPFNRIVFSPVKHQSEGYVESCDPSEADFWSVYLCLTNGEFSCIADCDTKEEAESLANFLKKIVKNHEI